MTLLDEDPRWRRLHELPWNCCCCEEEHQGLMVFGAHQPDAWPPNAQSEASPLVPGRTRNFLNDDFCIVNGEHFFIRCRFQLPIVGADEMFELGLWSSLSANNFKIYFDTFESGAQAALRPWFGWLSNILPGYPECFGLPSSVVPQNDGLRPLILLEPSDHPLAVHQRTGITFDEILDFYAATGHDIRPSLEAH